MTESHPADPGDAEENDVLGAYLEVLRARLSGERFALLIRAVETTCRLLGDGHQAVLELPGDGELAPELQREYLSLMAVMITGHLDHRLVEVTSPDGGKGWAVVDNAVSPSPARGADREWIDTELDGIVRASGSTAP
ncbi:hypothetical protein [Streptomyces sp. NPDC002044]|uniref:hypothetical protein n=1 Tax=Streptomyces sp. NPDC002044 TaxID=3154662 RepID=UPI003330F395